MRHRSTMHAGPTPGLLMALALLAAMLSGLLALVGAGKAGAQSVAPGTTPSTTQIDGMHDDLPPGIRKARPSGSVPADLPGRTERDCAVLRAVEVYQGVGRRTAVAVSPADLPGVTPDGPCPPAP